MKMRTVKDAFWNHNVMARLSDSARLAALGLLNFADDEGYFIANSKLVQQAIWPYMSSVQKARRVLNQLIDADWIEIRKVGDEFIGKIINFKKHQHIQEPQQSKLKAAFDHGEAIKRESAKRKKFEFNEPSYKEWEEYCISHGFGNIAKRSYEYYKTADWCDCRGVPIRNWKQKLIAVWFRDHNREKTQRKAQKQLTNTVKLIGDWGIDSSKI